MMGVGGNGRLSDIIRVIFQTDSHVLRLVYRRIVNIIVHPLTARGIEVQQFADDENLGDDLRVLWVGRCSCCGG